MHYKIYGFYLPTQDVTEPTSISNKPEWKVWSKHRSENTDGLGSSCTVQPRNIRLFSRPECTNRHHTPIPPCGGTARAVCLIVRHLQLVRMPGDKAKRIVTYAPLPADRMRMCHTTPSARPDTYVPARGGPSVRPGDRQRRSCRWQTGTRCRPHSGPAERPAPPGLL